PRARARGRGPAAGDDTPRRAPGHLARFRPPAGPRQPSVRRTGQTPIATSGATVTGGHPGPPESAGLLMTACQPALQVQAVGVAELAIAGLAAAGGGAQAGWEGLRGASWVA